VNEIGLVFQTREEGKSLEMPLGFDSAQPDGGCSDKTDGEIILKESHSTNSN
jgi:hypothetical protein